VIAVPALVPLESRSLERREILRSGTDSGGQPKERNSCRRPLVTAVPRLVSPWSVKY
jgi:hypothetical protein